MTETPPGTPSDDFDEYGLDSDAGNARVDLLVREVTAAVQAGEIERAEVVVALGDGLRDIAADHPDATGITTREAILRALGPVFHEAGWDVLEPFEF